MSETVGASTPVDVTKASKESLSFTIQQLGYTGLRVSNKKSQRTFIPSNFVVK